MENIFKDLVFKPLQSDYQSEFEELRSHSIFNQYNDVNPTISTTTSPKPTIIEVEEESVSETTNPVNPIFRLQKPTRVIQTESEKSEETSTYIPDTKSVTGNTSTSYIQNRDAIYEYLKDNFDLTREQAAGVIGVLYSESGLNPSIVRKGGSDTGLAQWVGQRRETFEKLFGKPMKEGTLEEQLEYIKYELNNTHQILPKLKKSTTPEEAAEIWFAGYENGGGGKLVTKEQINNTYGKHYPKINDVYSWMLDTRYKNARKIYNELS